MSAKDEISPAEAAGRLGEFETVDVRGQHEFEGPLGRVSGARLLPLPVLAQRAEELPRGRPLLLVCRSGVRSAKACAQLAELGFGPTVNLTGGMIAWNLAKLPVERARPTSVAALVENAVAWLAQLTAQAPDAARAKLLAELGAPLTALTAPTKADAARILGAIATLAGTPSDLDLSLAAFRAALAEL